MTKSNNMKTYRKDISLLAMAAFVLFAWVLSGCNSVKKSTDTHISKTDSIRSEKVDSAASSKKETKADFINRKEWDNELTVKFDDGAIREFRPFNLSMFGWQQVTNQTIDAGSLVELTGVKELIYRSNGNDSTATHKIDNSINRVDLKKVSASELSKFDKTKKVNKKGTRSSPVIWIVLGIVTIGGLFLFLIYKRSNI